MPMLYKNADGIPRETMMHVARRLREKGIKQQDIAKVLSCSQSTVSMWLRDDSYQIRNNDQDPVERIALSLMERLS